MPRFVEGQDRYQVTLLPESLDDFIAEDNAVRVVDAFVDELDLQALGFEGTKPAETGRPSYHPAVLLKIYIYGYLNRVQSTRRLERECQRNLELMWLTGRLAPDFKTIADFRRENGTGIRNVCRRFVELCRELKLLSQAVVAIDGSKFKAVNGHDRNFTPAKIQKRREQIEENIHRYLVALDTADRTLGPAEFQAKAARLNEKIGAMREQMRQLEHFEERLKDAPDTQLSLTDPDARAMSTSGRRSGIVGYNVQAAVDAKHHLIVAREVTNDGGDRAQLAPMAKAAREAIGKRTLVAIADRGYYRAADQGLPRRRHRRDPAQADDIERKGRRSIRQERLHLHRARRRISMSGRRTRDLPLHSRGRWTAGPPLLEQCLPRLSYERPVHAEQVQTYLPMGARRGADRGPASARQAPRCDASPSAHCRTCLRNTQALDGFDPLLDAHFRQRAHRDEPARACI